MKINQYCSVCKQHLDMEVIPTGDAGDDGVIWLRCPQCMGFLPKFSGERTRPEAPATSPAGSDAGDGDRDPAPTGGRRNRRSGPAVTAPSSATVPAADDEDADAEPGPELDPDHDDDIDEVAGTDVGDEETVAGAARRRAVVPSEPVAEYAALLAAADLAAARPYRPTDAFAVGDVVHHLAYGDVGVVVAKETLPGGRQAVKVYFEQAGVVRLIEQATGGH